MNTDGQLPDVSVIVPVYEDPRALEMCLDALAVQTFPRHRFEVVVVDNGSPTSHEPVVRRLASARLVVEPKPGSYNARNAGIRASRGKVLAFTDADCKPHPRWLEVACRYLEAHPEVDAVGGAIVLERSPNPTAAELYERITSFRQDRYVEEVGFAATANLVARRSTFEHVGLFDEGLKSSGDREWGMRMNAAGHRMAYLGEAAVGHPPRATLRQLVAKRRRLQGGFERVPHRAQAVGVHPPGSEVRPRGLKLAVHLLARPADHGVSRSQAFQVIGIAALLIATGGLERLRLMAGGLPVR